MRRVIGAAVGVAMFFLLLTASVAVFPEWGDAVEKTVHRVNTWGHNWHNKPPSAPVVVRPSPAPRR